MTGVVVISTCRINTYGNYNIHSRGSWKSRFRLDEKLIFKNHVQFIFKFLLWDTRIVKVHAIDITMKPEIIPC